jgi:hypothetical protein
MSKFFVGQMVRIVAYRFPPFADGDATLVGKVGEIIAPGEVSLGYQRWFVDIKSSKPNCSVCPIEGVMEPVYDGDVPASWSDCAWRPRELVKA